MLCFIVVYNGCTQEYFSSLVYFVVFKSIKKIPYYNIGIRV